MFIGLLNSAVNACDHIKCVQLDNQQCIIQSTLINLHPNEQTKGLRYYPFAVNLDRYVATSNTLNDLSNRVCVTKKKRFKYTCFNLITRINELKILTKHILCKCECKFDG